MPGVHKRSIKVSYSGDKDRLPRSTRGHRCHPRPHQMPPDVQNSRKPPCCSPPRSASREFRWRVPRTTGSRPRAAVFLQTLSPQGLYECACVCTSVRACVRVCIRMLGAVLMHLAGRGRTAECPAVCERHRLMQLRTVLLTNATASSWGSRIRETHTPACRSLRGYWNVQVHRARQALEELPAQQWPWEETRAHTHTPGHVASVSRVRGGCHVACSAGCVTRTPPRSLEGPPCPASIC